MVYIAKSRLVCNAVYAFKWYVNRYIYSDLNLCQTLCSKVQKMQTEYFLSDSYGLEEDTGKKSIFNGCVTREK